MSTYEILIKINDSNTWVDGQIISCMETGEWHETVPEDQADPDGRLLDLCDLHGGYDSNWGYMDLTSHAVVLVDATEEQIEDARPGKINYRDHMSAESIASMESGDIHHPNRMAVPFVFADVWEAI